MTKTFLHLQPIDKTSLALMFSLSLVMGGLVWGEKSCDTNCFFKTGPHVQYFSWQNQEIVAENTSFILSFDRPMNRESVEENLTIDPPLPGKISWAGRRLAYTLEFPAPYGESYQIYLRGAREKFINEDKPGQLIQPFVGEFKTRDRVLAYIGSQGEEQGRLILYNWTEQTKKILTPPNLVVMDFKSYPKGDHILFSASEKGRGIESLRELQLYKVKTELNSPAQNSANSATKNYPLELVLDNQDYQNNQFDLSQDGKIIVVQRLNRQDPSDFDLWAIKNRGKPERLNLSGGDFLITPDSQTLAVAQGEGVAILPLESGAKPLDFLPKFGKVLTFSADGSAAAMVNFNTDNPQLRYTRSLFYVNNQGVQKELLNLTGSIIDCQFNPNATYLYCLLTKLIEGEEYIEQPYFAEIELKTAEVFPIMALPDYQDIEISMAPDGLGILFDQVITSDTFGVTDELRTNSGEAIVGGNLWLLIPPSINSSESKQAQLEELPLIGFHPQWLP